MSPTGWRSRSSSPPRPRPPAPPRSTAHVDVLVTTVLPTSWPALHRADGMVLLALQTDEQLRRRQPRPRARAARGHRGRGRHRRRDDRPARARPAPAGRAGPERAVRGHRPGVVRVLAGPRHRAHPGPAGRDRGGRRRHHRHGQARGRRRRVLVPDGRPRVPALGAAARGAGGARRASPACTPSASPASRAPSSSATSARPGWSCRCGSWPRGRRPRTSRSPSPTSCPGSRPRSRTRRRWTPTSGARGPVWSPGRSPCADQRDLLG